MNLILRIFSVFLIVTGVSLTLINVYGIFNDVRSDRLNTEPSRFPNDVSLNYEQSMHEIKPVINESDVNYTLRMTNVISQSLAHIHWNEEADTTRYNQLIPVWENYFLYFMGRFSGIPEFEKYHYASYQRSLKRGIGICGDASMVMSQLLDKQGIKNQILSFPGHVVVAANIDGQERVFDPDFGVAIPFSPEKIKTSPTQIFQHYQDMGYSTREIQGLMRAYNLGFKRWDGVKHFITNKYYFEKITYALKWPLPIIVLLLGVFLFYRQKRSASIETL
jgi:hypothetical protein